MTTFLVALSVSTAVNILARLLGARGRRGRGAEVLRRQFFAHRASTNERLAILEHHVIPDDITDQGTRQIAWEQTLAADAAPPAPPTVTMFVADVAAPRVGPAHLAPRRSVR